MKSRYLVLIPLLLSFLLPAIGVLAVSMQSYLRVWESAARDAVNVLDLIAENARNAFETQDLVLEMVGDMLQDMDAAEVAAPATSARLAAIDARLGPTIAISVADAAGRVVAASLRAQIGLSVAETDYFRVLRAEPRQRYVGAAYVGRVSNLPSFSMARRRPAADGSFAGTIQVAVSPAHFEANFRAAARQHAGAAMLFLPDGAVLARHPATRLDTRLDPQGAILQAVARQSREGRIDAVSTIDGVDRVTFYRLLSPFDVYVSFGVDLPQRRRQWQAETAYYGFLAICAAILLSAATWITWRSLVTRADALLRLKEEAEARHAAESVLQRTRTLEALGRMARGVAHDVNNLLTIVVGHLETLADAVRGTPAERSAERATDAAQAGARLAASLLAYARTQVLQLDAVAMGGFLEELRPQLQEAAGATLRLRLSLAPGLPWCRIDRAQCAAALRNLVVNAREAMPAGGEVVISASAVELDADDLSGAAAAAPGRFVAVAVRDTGRGMAAETLAHAFDPFFTTKPEGSGAGLGLSQVLGLMQQLGGHVGIESLPGVGTTVTLFLPAIAGPPAPPAPAPAAGWARTAGEMARILVVDDQPEIRALTRTVLSRAGYAVDVAASAEDALELLAGQARELVLSDVVMPGGMEGTALAQRLRQSHPGVRVLLMSGYAPDVAVLAELKVGFLAKPFTRQELLEAVRSALG